MTITEHPPCAATVTDPRAAALAAAARGWPVFPVRPWAKKPPVFKRWPEHASTDPDRIHTWWDRDPARNLLTGLREATPRACGRFGSFVR
ncbi:bifunctional DNA primase/polymerase [Nocardia takedensis]